MNGLTTIDIVVEAFSTSTLGIKSDRWYNLEKDISDMDFDSVAKKIKTLSKGDKIKLNLSSNNEYVDFEITEKSKEDDIVRFDDVLQQAHDRFKDNLSIETEILLTGPEMFLAKAKVIIFSPNSAIRVFTGHGDATKENTNDSIQTALPRMAETRAIARALRFALGTTVIAEELPNNKDMKA